MATLVIHARDSKQLQFAGSTLAAIDRSTVFGNPFPMSDKSDKERDRVCDEYAVYFKNRIDTDPKFRNQVLSLKGKVLVCWCKPKRCHGDTIAAWLDAQVD